MEQGTGRRKLILRKFKLLTVASSEDVYEDLYDVAETVSTMCNERDMETVRITEEYMSAEENPPFNYGCCTVTIYLEDNVTLQLSEYTTHSKREGEQYATFMESFEPAVIRGRFTKKDIKEFVKRALKLKRKNRRNAKIARIRDKYLKFIHWPNSILSKILGFIFYEMKKKLSCVLKNR